MNRPYRAIPIGKTKFVYGWHVKTDEGSRIIGLGLCDEDVGCGFAQDGGYDPGIDEDCDCYEVIPSTVGQSTGLKDENGVEIYEGDIVRCDYTSAGGSISNSRIAWHESAYHLIDTCTSKLSEWTVKHYKLEIIGNIHQNKDLLDA